LQFTIDSVNDAPVLTGTAAVLANGTEDSAYVITQSDLLLGWSDPDGDPLSVENLSTSNGTLVDNGDGTWTLTPEPNFNGPVSLTYDVSDEQESTAADLQFTIDSVPDAGIGSSDQANIIISGTSGYQNNSRIEFYSIERVVTGKGKNRTVELVPNYTSVEDFKVPGVDGITFIGGESANNISAAGVDGDPIRTAFDGQTIINGGLGSDTIIGGTLRNWLQGGGIVDPLSNESTDVVDTLIGTNSAIDVFDVRSADFQSDAYAASSSGSALIQNYDQSNDYIALAQSSGDYVFKVIETTSGKGKKKRVTQITGYEIYNSNETELIATVNHVSGTALTEDPTAHLNILYGTDSPTDTLISESQLFF